MIKKILITSIILIIGSLNIANAACQKRDDIEAQACSASFKKMDTRLNSICRKIKEIKEKAVIKSDLPTREVLMQLSSDDYKYVLSRGNPCS